MARLVDAAAFVDGVLRAVLAVFRVAERGGFARFRVVLADVAVLVALLALARLVALVFVDFLACVAFDAEDTFTDDLRGFVLLRVVAGFAALAAAIVLRALAARTAAADRWTIENRTWGPTG